MRRKIMFLLLLTASCLGLLLRVETPSRSQNAPDGRTSPAMVKLSAEAKLGAVAFSHADHTTKNRSRDLKAPIDCVVCHHTAMPVAEVAKHAGHKTAWPMDRTTTLTSDLFTKEPTAPVVDRCRACHARAGEKPTLMPAIPTMKSEGSSAATTLNNQQAFHRNCGDCHDAVAKVKKDSTGPTSKKCTACHKKTAA